MITVFYARYAYLNPGWPLFLEHLRHAPPPDLRAIDVTTLTVESVIRLARESSTIVIDQSIENAGSWVLPDEFSIYRIRGNQPTSFFSDISERLWSLDARRVFMSNFDLHDTRLPSFLEKLRGKVDAFVWMHEKPPRAVEEVPAQYRDAWLSNGSAGAVTWNIVRDIAPVRIELPFAIAEYELASTKPLALWDASVPGAAYATRLLARQSIRREGLSLAPAQLIGRSSRGVSLVLGKTLPNEYASLAAIAVQQWSQRAIVRASATCFVCGSGVAYATRKFFEVPGQLVPMVAYPCVGFEDYGFRDGVNVLATAPEDAGRAVRHLRANRGTAERMARAGQEMIRCLHLMSVRVGQFAACLEALERGRLNGAEFRGGTFEVF